MLLDSTVQRYTKGLYGVALLLIVVPLVDILLRSFAGEVGSLQWRFGSVGLLFGNMGTIVLGTGLAGLVAAILGHRGVLRAIGFFSVLMAVVVLALLVLFALDAIQMRRLVAVAMKRSILVSSAGAAFSATFAMLALVTLGRSSLIASRADRPSAGRTKAAPSPLVAQAAPSRPRVGETV